MRPASLPARWLLAGLAPLFAVILVAAALNGSTDGGAVALFGHVALVLTAGVLQAMVLRSHHVPPWRWILATVLGFVAGMTLGIGLLATLDGLGHELMGMMLGTALFGASLGAAQALAMRRAHGWRGDWVVASTAAWVIVGLLWLGGWHLARGNVQGDGVLSPFARLYQSGNAELLLLSIGLAGSALLTGPLLPRVVSGQGTATVAMDGERPS